MPGPLVLSHFLRLYKSPCGDARYDKITPSISQLIWILLSSYIDFFQCQHVKPFGGAQFGAWDSTTCGLHQQMPGWNFRRASMGRWVVHFLCSLRFLINAPMAGMAFASLSMFLLLVFSFIMFNNFTCYTPVSPKHHSLQFEGCLQFFKSPSTVMKGTFFYFHKRKNSFLMVNFEIRKKCLWV